jgi:hypothetical protein
MLRYEYVEPSTETLKATDFLTGTFLPLLNEFWKSRGAEYYQAENWDMQAVDFTQLWMNKVLAIILAYDGDQPVGFILAAQVRPFLQARRRFQIEQWYGRSAEIEAGLFKHLGEIFKFFQAEVLVVPEYPPEMKCPLPEGWAPATLRPMIRTQRYYER